VTFYEIINRIAERLPNERFIMNLSQGFSIACDVITFPSGDSSCTPFSIQQGVSAPLFRAWIAEFWKRKTHTRWNDFLVTNAAGNNGRNVASRRYPGLNDARFNSFVSTAEQIDPFFGFISDTALWRGTLDPNLPDLTATTADVADLRQAIVDDHLDTVGGAPNVLTVGSTTPGVQFSDLRLSDFSGINAGVAVVGENVLTFDGFRSGTSFAAPQVAGLASYLWLLSDDLRLNQPIETTRLMLSQNTRVIGRDRVIDAYAAVLSLDRAQLPTPQSAPVRLAVLDIDNNGRFDEADIDAFAAHFFDATGAPLSPTTRDFSRFDLNGDGFTGGTGTDFFDLDRIGAGAAQYVAPVYDTDITQTIEGVTVHYNERGVTDVEVLCYYAYSSLFGGIPDVRDDVLRGRCFLSIDPTSVTLQRGAQQQFTAHTPNNGAVTWSASGGAITTAGLYTAGNFPGTFAVRATSVADPNVFAEATVTISGASNIAAIFIDSVGLNVGRSRTITAIAVDVDGNEVTVAPSAWSWSIAPTGIASLAPSGPRATLTGVSQGTATLTVSLPSSGVSATSTVMVNNLFGTYQGTITRITANGEEPLAGHVVIFLFEGALTMDVSLVVFGNIDTFVPIAASGTTVSGSDRSYNWVFTVSPSGGTLSGTGTHTSAPLSWRVEVVKVN